MKQNPFYDGLRRH